MSQFFVNSAKEIVGSYWDGSREHAFILSDGVYTSFDHPDAEETAAWGVNSVGQIVGSYRLADGTWRGFLRDGMNYSELVPHEGSPDTTPVGINDSAQTIAHDINNLGQVVGQYWDANGNRRGFLATPIPEPATPLLVAIGAYAMLCIRHKVWTNGEH